MSYGITSTGFAKKTLAVIKSELESAYKQAFGNALNVRAPSLAGTQIGIHSDREAAIWDIAEEAWNARAASTSQGVSLDNVGELTAEERLGAAPSKTLLQYFFGTPGTIIGTNLIVSVAGNSSAKFSPSSAVTLGAGTNEVQLLSFSATPDAGNFTLTMPDGQVTAVLAWNANAAAVQAAINALTAIQNWSGVTVSGSFGAGFTVTFGGASGLQDQPILIATSALTHTAAAVTITPSVVTQGVAQAVATMVALATGPVLANARTLTVIETPITGLTSTTNVVDAQLGRLVETDPEYRIRRANELQVNASTTVEAIRIKLKKVSNVNEAIVYENTTLTTDVNGVPGKALHIYVDGGTDQDVGNAIWLNIGGGIQTYGSVSVNVVDSQGLTQIVKFDRPVQKNVYAIVTITKDSAVYPSNGDSLALAAVLAYGSTLKIGQTVLLYPKLLPAIVDNVPGIIDIQVKIGFSPTPTASANLTCAINERAIFSSANTSVTS